MKVESSKTSIKSENSKETMVVHKLLHQ